MKKPKKPKPPRLKPPPTPPSPLPPETPKEAHSWIRWGGYIAATLAVIASVVGIILFVDWARDQYAKTTPEIAPKESEASSRTPPAFVVKNISPYFAMGGDVQLVCGIDSATFEVNGKRVGFAMPVTTGIANPPIEPGKTAEYRCDPSAYMKVENDGISLMGLFAKMPEVAGAELRLTEAIVRVGVKYRIFGIQQESVSEMWKLERSPSFRWTEMRPLYK
jgi:hypothetical protein